MPAPARRQRETTPVASAPGGALQAVSDAVEAGAGLPELLRATARALDASLVLVDRAGAKLAVAARSPTDEASLSPDASDVTTIELRVADAVVGRLRMRLRGATPSAEVLSLVKVLIASEVERFQAPGRASEQAVSTFIRALLAGDLTDRAEVVLRAAELRADIEAGATVIVARAHPHVPADDDWRERVLGQVERGARAPGLTALAALADRPDGHPGEVAVLVAGADEATGTRVAQGILRELEANLQGFTFAIGRSRVAGPDPVELRRAGNEALLAANVAEGEQNRVMGFDETGAYRLLLQSMSDDPDELQRFYSETIAPLIVYDERYTTELVPTLEAFLEADGNFAQTAQRLFTHRHTIRYRLERVRELCGLDVGSTDGREKLSLGLKAMRVLGIAAPHAPATEAGAEGGRVPGTPKSR